MNRNKDAAKHRKVRFFLYVILFVFLILAAFHICTGGGLLLLHELSSGPSEKKVAAFYQTHSAELQSVVTYSHSNALGDYHWTLDDDGIHTWYLGNYEIVEINDPAVEPSLEKLYEDGVNRIFSQDNSYSFSLWSTLSRSKGLCYTENPSTIECHTDLEETILKPLMDNTPTEWYFYYHKWLGD